MKRLPNPDDEVLKAVIDLEDNRSFEVIKAYLLDECAPFIAERMRSQKEEVVVRWEQGAGQAIDDLREMFGASLGWMEKRLTQRKKEGSSNE